MGTSNLQKPREENSPHISKYGDQWKEGIRDQVKQQIIMGKLQKEP